MVLQSAMGAETARNISAFRAFRTHLRRSFEGYRGSFVSIDVLLTWGTTKFTGISVKHLPRVAGQSNYTVRKLITHALNMVTGFSVIPLQVATIVGFVCTALGVAILAFAMGNYLVRGGVVPGFTFIASTIAIFSGAQLFSMGIIGEYLARVHFRLLDKPTYSIRSETSSP